MTTRRRQRLLALALVLSLLALAPPVASGTVTPALPAPSEMIGGLHVGGRFPALACLGCMAGGVMLALSPSARILAAAMKRGSFFALVGCADMCYRALSR